MTLGAIVAGIGAVLLLIAALLGEPATLSRADPRAALLMFGFFLLSGGGWLAAMVLRNRANGHEDFDIGEWFRREY